MASKHGTKPKRDKKFKQRAINPQSAYQVVRNNWRAQAANAHDTTAGAALIERFSQPVGEDQQQDLSLEYRGAWVALLAGSGGMDDWHTVTEALNIATVLCERGFGIEYQNLLIDALNHVFVVKQHFLKVGHWLWSDEAHAAINESLDVHAAQLEHAIQADVLSAISEVARRIEANNVLKEAA